MNELSVVVQLVRTQIVHVRAMRRKPPLDSSTCRKCIGLVANGSADSFHFRAAVRGLFDVMG